MEKCSYEIFPDRGMIIETFKGEITIEGYSKMKTDEYNDAKFNLQYSVLADLRETNVLYKNKEVQQLIDFLFKNIDKITGRKSALVTSTKQQVVGSMLFDKLSKKLPFSVKIFSSMEAAIAWLEI